MKRYFLSFFIAFFTYLIIALFLYNTFEKNQIIIKKEDKEKRISLNQIEVKQEKKVEKTQAKVEKKTIKNEKIVEKQIVKKEIKKTIVKKKIYKKETVSKVEKFVEEKETKEEQEKVLQTEDNTPVVEKEVQVSKIDEKKEYLSKHLEKIRSLIHQNITYPKRARKLSIQGVVIVKFKINSNGTVESITIIDGHKFLQKATIRAIQNASKYFPKVTKSIEIQIPIEYKLM